MSKYDPLWEWIAENGTESFTLSFEEIGRIAGVSLDHSFLNCKKELEACGYSVGRISVKERTVAFRREENK